VRAKLPDPRRLQIRSRPIRQCLSPQPQSQMNLEFLFFLSA